MRKLTKAILIKHLKAISVDSCTDPEEYHCMADNLLLQYINDDKVTKTYAKIKKWYA